MFNGQKRRSKKFASNFKSQNPKLKRRTELSIENGAPLAYRSSGSDFRARKLDGVSPSQVKREPDTLRIFNESWWRLEMIEDGQGKNGRCHFFLRIKPALPAAALAWDRLSETDCGEWARPQIKIPSLSVSTGLMQELDSIFVCTLHSVGCALVLSQSKDLVRQNPFFSRK